MNQMLQKNTYQSMASEVITNNIAEKHLKNANSHIMTNNQ